MQRILSGKCTQCTFLKDWRALKSASGKLKSDRGIVMKAVSQSWQALNFASTVLSNDHDIVMKGVLQNPEVKPESMLNFSEPFSACAPLCCKNMCCASCFCTGGGGAVSSRSQQFPRARKAKCQPRATSEPPRPRWKPGQEQNRGPENQDSQHMLKQHRGYFPDIQSQNSSW